MENERKRKEIVHLLENIQDHFKRLEDYRSIPTLELDVILSKTAKLQEKVAVLKYMMKKQEDGAFESTKPVEIGKLEKDAPSFKSENPSENPQAAETTEPPKENSVATDSLSGDAREVIEKEEVEVEKSVDIAETSSGKGIGKIEDYLDLNARFSSEDHSLSDQLKKQPIANLLTAIGLNERYLFANQLFSGDMAKFIDEIKKLNSFDSEQEALDYFDNKLSNKESWKSSEDLVEAFRLLIQRRFQ